MQTCKDEMLTGSHSLCKSAIRKLLIKDEHKRLGSSSGASEVKQHKWFASVNWGLLRHMTPPVSPPLVPSRDSFDLTIESDYTSRIKRCRRNQLPNITRFKITRFRKGRRGYHSRSSWFTNSGGECDAWHVDSTRTDFGRDARKW